MQTAQEAAVTAAAAARGNSGAEGAGGSASETGAGSALHNSAGSPAATDPKSGAAGPPGSDPLPGVDGAGGSGGVGAVESAAGAAAAAESCLLLDLEKKPLLKVFVFLNATEVLRAAQVCRPMFRKVRGRVCCCLRSRSFRCCRCFLRWVVDTTWKRRAGSERSLQRELTVWWSKIKVFIGALGQKLCVRCHFF